MNWLFALLAGGALYYGATSKPKTTVGAITNAVKRRPKSRGTSIKRAYRRAASPPPLQQAPSSGGGGGGGGSIEDTSSAPEPEQDESENDADNSAEDTSSDDNEQSVPVAGLRWNGKTLR